MDERWWLGGARGKVVITAEFLVSGESTDLSSNESHRQVGMDRVLASRCLGGVMVSMLIPEEVEVQTFYFYKYSTLSSCVQLWCCDQNLIKLCTLYLLYQPKVCMV